MSTSFTIEKRDGWRVSVAKVRKDGHDARANGGYTATVEKGAGNLMATFRVMRDDANYGRRRGDEFRWYAELVQGAKPIGNREIDGDAVNLRMRKDTLRECAECCLEVLMIEESVARQAAEEARRKAEETAAREAAARDAVEALHARFGADGREAAYAELKQLTTTARQWQDAADALARLLSLADPKRFEHWSIVQDFGQRRDTSTT